MQVNETKKRSMLWLRTDSGHIWMLVKEVSGFCCLNEPVSEDVSGDDTGAVMAEVVLFMPIVLLASVLEVF